MLPRMFRSRTWSRLLIILFALSFSIVLLLDTLSVVEALPPTGIQLSKSAQTQIEVLHTDKLSRTPAQRQIDISS